MDALPPLSSLALAAVLDGLASSRPVPGGGTAAALTGAVAAGLVEMVAALSLRRAEAGPERDLLADLSRAASARRGELLELAQADADAYAAVVAARRLPREGKAAAERSDRVASATRQATVVPLHTAEAASAVLGLSARIAPIGNRSAVSDAGVSAVLASAAVRAAVFNVRINLPGLGGDDPVRHDAERQAEALWESAAEREAEVVALVTARMPPPT